MPGGHAAPVEVRTWPGTGPRRGWTRGHAYHLGVWLQYLWGGFSSFSHDRRKMAEKSTQSQSLAEGVDKELTCAICLSRYDQPKILPCLHSYCKRCLEDMVKKSREKKSITCPQCKVVHELPPQGIDGFTTFFTINNLLELLHIHENAAAETPVESIKCSSGLDEYPAVARCLTCSDYLCETCHTIHQKQKVTKDHDVKTLEEIKHSDKKTGVRSLHKRKYCMEHKDKQLELYCKTCKKVICLVCAVVNHSKHDCAVINEVRAEIQKELEKQVSEVHAKEVEFRDRQKFTENLLRISNEAAESSKIEISKACDGLIQAIENRCVQLLSDVNRFHAAEVKQITAKSVSVAHSLLRMSDSIRFMRQLLDNGDDVEVITVSDQTAQTLSGLANMACDLSTLRPSLLRPKFESVKENIDKFGKVVCTIEPSDIKLSNVPMKVLMGLESSFNVFLSKEVSERGYEGALEVIISSPRTLDQLPDIKKKQINSWTVSFTLDQYGKYQAKVQISDTYKMITLLCEDDTSVQKSVSLLFSKPRHYKPSTKSSLFD